MNKIWARDTSKLNPVELVKLEKDGLEIIKDIARFAAEGFQSIEKGDFDRLKWLGLYVQRQKEDGYFLLRVKIPGGILTSPQAKVLTAIAKEYGRGILDITTRHAIQFHWIQVQNLPDVFKRLKECGLTTLEAAGDCPRNIVANPLEGIDPDEFIDCQEIVAELNRYFENNPDFSNLPRKFKTAVSGGIYNSVHAEINDLAFVPAHKEVDGKSLKGFNVLVGGGLSAKPQLAVKLDLFVIPEQVVAVASAVASLFRDFGYRAARNHARLKFLVADWGAEKFTAEVKKITGALPGAGEDATTDWNAGHFIGIHRQKQTGLSYLGLPISAGRLKADDWEELANVAQMFGDGNLRTLNSQSLLIPNIQEHKIPELTNLTLVRNLLGQGDSFASRAIVCTGKEFCPFGLVETKERILELTRFLDQHIPLDTPVRLHISGCVHSCGQPQIADIGLQGTAISANGKPEEAFEIWLGGWLGPDATLATKLEGRVSHKVVGFALLEFLKFYQEQKNVAEAFSEFILRRGVSEFQAILYKFTADANLVKVG